MGVRIQLPTVVFLNFMLPAALPAIDYWTLVFAPLEGLIVPLLTN
jgi:hypothetical protein